MKHINYFLVAVVCFILIYFIYKHDGGEIQPSYVSLFVVVLLWGGFISTIIWLSLFLQRKK